MNIVSEIGLPAMLEQLAEECAELAQACLKESRYLRCENPVCKSHEALRENLTEEIADVELCLNILHESEHDARDMLRIADIRNQKRKRWEDRLNVRKGDKGNDGRLE